MEKIKIILVDDHQMFRDGVKSILHDEQNIELVGEVGNGLDLFRLLETVQPDLIVTDISMPDLSGIEVAKYVSENFPGIKILILSMHVREDFIIKAIEAGADGYLPKDASMNELLEAIYTISRGESYFNRKISDAILKSFISHSRPQRETEKRESLTRRELEIIRNVVDGQTNREIADTLCISIRTVDSHKNNIMHKLNLKSSVELVKYAIKNNLANLD